MSEDVARALGAGTAEDLMIAGKPCKIRPLTIREITEVQRECLRDYRSNYLANLKESVDSGLLSEEALINKIDETARWDVDDLPRKYVYDVSDVTITGDLKVWMKNELGVDDATLNRAPKVLKRLLSAVLDIGNLTEDKCKELTGTSPRKLRTGYVNWWVTGTLEGMITMVYLCVRHEGVTKEDVITELSDKQVRLQTLSREIESLTAPQVGNG